MKRFILISILLFSILLSWFPEGSEPVKYKPKCKECKNPNESHWM